MGGEKAKMIAGTNNVEGSPPHGRGKGQVFRNACAGDGITPAQAGKRTRSWRAYGCPWDHPRMGGEKANGSDAPDDDEGSPPHGQGKDDVFRGQILLPGITPAWAGKRPTRPNVEFEVKDHPRVGGEKARTLIVQNEPQGSPPRRRGKDLGCKVGSRQPGITPA